MEMNQHQDILIKLFDFKDEEEKTLNRLKKKKSCLPYKRKYIVIRFFCVYFFVSEDSGVTYLIHSGKRWKYKILCPIELANKHKRPPQTVINRETSDNAVLMRSP